MRTRRFHISVRSALAAFLLAGGLQAALSSVDQPLGSWAIKAVNWFISRIKADSFRLNQTAISWTYFWAELVFSLILVMLAVWIGAGVRPSRRKTIS